MKKKNENSPFLWFLLKTLHLEQRYLEMDLTIGFPFEFSSNMGPYQKIKTIFVHGEISPWTIIYIGSSRRRLNSVCLYSVCHKFRSVFLGQVKFDWADFWICYSSNKT